MDSKTAETNSDLEKKIHYGPFHKSLEERVEEYGGQLNLSEEYDWGEPVGDEVR